MTAPTTPSPERQPADAGGEPAVPIRESIAPDYLICLEDGCKFKSLKRHLRVKYDLSPEQYRAKWGLPDDYPMVAPNYAKAREDLARQLQKKADPKSTPAPQAQPDARAVEALRAANEALALVTAFESDARYIMGNTNFAILQQRREQVKQALQALSAPAADDGWRPIESAPKDGTVIDAWRNEGGRETVSWGYPPHECGEMGRLCDSDWHSIRAPGWVCNTFGEFLGRKHNPFTHWRPLPAPPAAPTDAEERS